MEWRAGPENNVQNLESKQLFDDFVFHLKYSLGPRIQTIEAIST
jgi:hypothetical protein